MKICPKCGMQLGDNAVFCNNCGADLSAPDAQYESSQADTQYEAPQQGGVYTQPAVPRGVEVLRRVCTSLMALVAIIAFTASVVFAIISAVSGASGTIESLKGVVGDLKEFTDEIGITEQVNDYINNAHSASLFSTLITNLPAILTVAGLWMIFANCMNRRSSYAKTGGFTLIKVIQVITLVLVCVGFALVILLGVFLFALAKGAVGSAPEIFSEFNADVDGVQSVISTVGIVVILVIAVVAALVISFYACAIKTINTMRRTAATGIISTKVSGYLAVLSCIVGGFTAVTALNYDVLGSIANFCSAVAYIAFGCFIFQYKNAMRNAELESQRIGANNG